MPIKGAILAQNGTLAVTGGTPKTFTEVGETIRNGVKVSDLSVADARIRPTITCVNRPAQLSSAGVYVSKDKRTAKLVQPRLAADGTLTFPLGEIRTEFTPDMTDADKITVLCYLGQLMFDPDFQQFFLNGATA